MRDDLGMRPISESHKYFLSGLLVYCQEKQSFNKRRKTTNPRTEDDWLLIFKDVFEYLLTLGLRYLFYFRRNIQSVFRVYNLGHTHNVHWYRSKEAIYQLKKSWEGTNLKVKILLTLRAHFYLFFVREIISWYQVIQKGYLECHRR